MPGPLAPRRRLALLAVGYALYALASPGAITTGGSPLGALGVVFWALAASRPGPRSFRTEWLAGTIGFGILIHWMGYVFLVVLPLVVAGYGVYAAYGGVLMKRLAGRLPLALATPLAWVGFESLLAWVPPPAGLSWLRLGHYLNDWPTLAGSGRVWGVTGLSFALAALAGLVADLWLQLRVERRPRPRALSLVCGLAPAAIGLALGAAVPVPESEPGPRLLLVQPAFEQKRKQAPVPGEDLFREQFELTRHALADLEQRGVEPPDLVCWGETMLLVTKLADDGLIEALDEDLVVDPWNLLGPLGPEQRKRVVAGWIHREEQVRLLFFGGEDRSGSRFPRTLPPNTSFLCGAELFLPHDGRLRRMNTVVLWDREGRRAGMAAKVHLAPGGETMVGLEKLGWVRNIIFEIANYVPDLLAGEEVGVLELEGAEGRTWRFGATTCFDNAFTDVYAEPLRRTDLDFHLVASNEAWYEKSFEVDQMIAFSRLLALCTGRSLVRATNGGISSLIGPGGVELQRLAVGGEDRMVRGTMAVRVPVPTAAARASRTPFTRVEPWLLPLGALLPLLAMLFAGFGCVTRTGEEASGSRVDRDLSRA